MSNVLKFEKPKRHWVKDSEKIEIYTNSLDLSNARIKHIQESIKKINELMQQLRAAGDSHD